MNSFSIENNPQLSLSGVHQLRYITEKSVFFLLIGELILCKQWIVFLACIKQHLFELSSREKERLYDIIELVIQHRKLVDVNCLIRAEKS